MNKNLEEKLFELIAKYDPINSRNLCPNQPNKRNMRDYRLPIPGTTIHKEYKGQAHIILVLKDSFEYKQRHYKSLSAIAKKLPEAIGMDLTSLDWRNNDKRCSK